MERSLRVSSGQARLDLHAQVSTASAAPRQPVLTTAVGASYAFDPGVDGLASIYAARVLERGIDPRVLCAEIRADRLGLVDRGPQRRALLARTRTSRFGRGTAAHLRSQASPIQLSPASKASLEKRPDRAAQPDHQTAPWISDQLVAQARGGGSRRPPPAAHRRHRRERPGRPAAVSLRRAARRHARERRRGVRCRSSRHSRRQRHREPSIARARRDHRHPGPERIS